MGTGDSVCLDEFVEKVFGNRCIYFARNTVYLHFDIRGILANLANRVNCANSCLEMLLERLSQKYDKMNACWLLRIYEDISV